VPPLGSPESGNTHSQWILQIYGLQFSGLPHGRQIRTFFLTQAEAFFSIHSKEANDLVDQYKGRFDIDASMLTLTPTSCLEIKFGDNLEGNIKGYIKIPIVPSAKNDDRTNIPANSFAYVPLLKDALYSNFTKKTYGDLHTLLRESAFSSDTVTNGKGMIIGMNDKNGYNFIIREQYKISFTAPATADSSAMCSLKEPIYRNCAVVHGPLSISYDGPREHVDLSLLSSSLPIRSTSVCGYSQF
jgi:hypothetical protein